MSISCGIKHYAALCKHAKSQSNRNPTMRKRNTNKRLNEKLLDCRIVVAIDYHDAHGNKVSF